MTTPPLPPAATEQRAPVPAAGPSCHDTLCARLPPDHPVVADLQARKALGLQRYGVHLTAHNGRDAVLDLYQELLDAAAYSEQARQEGVDGAAALGDVLLVLAAQVQAALAKRDGGGSRDVD